MAETGVRRLPRALQPFAARPRLLGAFVVGVGVFFLTMPLIDRWTTRALIGWDVGVMVFLALAVHSMIEADHDRLRARARDHDEGRHFILLLAIFAAVASVAALVGEMALARGHGAARELQRVALSGGTIALSWAFVQFIFALHYAHAYYGETDEPEATHRAGLDFPGDEAPDYWDFLHFSLIIGATAQTADITIVSKELRRVSTVHSLIAFAFNTAVLALMINLAAGLF